MMGSGAALMCALALMAALLLPARPRHATRKTQAKCVRDPVVRVNWICGDKVFHTNPGGERVFIGSTVTLFAPHAHVLLDAQTR